MPQSEQSIEKEITKSLKLNYLLYTPDGYDSTGDSWPLMLFLHGASRRGDDLRMVEGQGPPMLIAREGRSFPFLICSPQCPENRWWDDELQLDMLDALLTEVVANYRVDENRLYLTGLSMGGAGTWRLSAMFPERFAAAAPVCGYGNPDDASLLSDLPVWVFHGAKDPTIPAAESEKMVNALEKVGGKVRITVYPEAGHDSWTETYNNPELYRWFLSNIRA